MSKFNGNQVFKLCILCCIALIVCIYFKYRADRWPFGIEAMECLASLMAVGAVYLFVWALEKRKLTSALQSKTLAIGLYTGILWIMEIGMNNIIQPGLPLRDNLDDIFWAIIALIILASACYEANKANKIITGIKAGFWSGLASGAIACVTALTLIVFGMALILKDPINIQEWMAQKTGGGVKAMATYFAYQTLAGAIMHLIILGVIMGFLLGAVGGVAGKIFSLFRNKNVLTPLPPG